MTHIATIDTETTHLSPAKGQMWELAVIVDGHHTHSEWDGEWVFTFPEAPIDGADPAALAVSHYYRRIEPINQARIAPYGIPRRATVHVVAPDASCAPDPLEGVPGWVGDHDAARLIAMLLDGADAVAGVRPEFDKPFIEDYLTGYGHHWTAHYHTIDVAQVTHWRLGRTSADLPYRSDDLAAALGVEPPAHEERHTALGDARWARRWLHRLDELAPEITDMAGVAA
jgi:hypothetical protein